MRYDTPVSFIKEDNVYNYDTGNTDASIINRTDTLANVSDTSAKMCDLLYGKVKNEAYTIIIQNDIGHAFEYIMLDGKKYTVDRSRKQRLTTTFFISGGG